MHITHLTSSTFFGGPERQMLELAEQLRPHHSSDIVSFSEGGRCEAFLTKANERGFFSHALENDTPRFRKAIREVAELLSTRGTEVLCCHGYKAAILGRIAARRCGIPALAVSRGWTAETWKVRVYEWLERFNLRWMDGVICVSAAQANRVRATGVVEEKIHLIHNAINLSRFASPDPGARASLQAYFAKPPARIIGAAGRLSPEKGFDLFIEAALSLARESSDVGFVHFGEGALKENLQQRIRQCGLEDRVVLAGYCDHLDQLLPALDAFVLPSYTEGLPNVVLEAQAAGVPVIATAVGGTPELVLHEQTGLLIPPGDANAIRVAMERVLGEPEMVESLRQLGREHVETSFTFAAQAAKYEALFHSLKQPSPRGHEKPCPIS